MYVWTTNLKNVKSTECDFTLYLLNIKSANNLLKLLNHLLRL